MGEGFRDLGRGKETREKRAGCEQYRLPSYEEDTVSDRTRKNKEIYVLLSFCFYLPMRHSFHVLGWLTGRQKMGWERLFGEGARENR